MSESRSRVDMTVDAIVAGIADGVYPIGSTLPPEEALAAEIGVSRLTLREAVSTLRSKSVLRVRHGSGTFVNPASQWIAVDPHLLDAKLRRVPHMPEQLIEARAFIEGGAAELAALLRSDEDLHVLTLQIEEMTAASRERDVERFVRADLAFHDTIITASRNAFLHEILEPIRSVMFEVRHQTSSVPAIQRNAIKCHRDILDQLRAADPQRSGQAMRDHMAQTRRDYDRHVAHAVTAAGQVLASKRSHDARA